MQYAYWLKLQVFYLQLWQQELGSCPNGTGAVLPLGLFESDLRVYLYRHILHGRGSPQEHLLPF